MAAPKGTKPPNMGKGRRFGVPNRINKELREMVLGALESVGGQGYLEEQARKSKPEAFLRLVGQCLPRDVKITAPMALKISLVSRDRQP